MGHQMSRQKYDWEALCDQLYNWDQLETTWTDAYPLRTSFRLTMSEYLEIPPSAMSGVKRHWRTSNREAELIYTHGLGYRKVTDPSWIKMYREWNQSYNATRDQLVGASIDREIIWNDDASVEENLARTAKVMHERLMQLRSKLKSSNAGADQMLRLAKLDIMSDIIKGL